MDTSQKSIQTKEECVRFLKRIGLLEGKVLLVHQAISSVWPLEDHAVTLIDALSEILGPQGTLCVINTVPSNQEPDFNIPKARKRRERILSLSLRTYRNSFQSPLFLAASAKEGRHFTVHPKYSLCCIGKYSKYFTDDQALNFPFGYESCFESMYELNADYLMIDTTLSQCEEIKLFANKSADSVIEVNGASVFSEGRNQWKQYLDYQFDLSLIAPVIQKSGLIKQDRMNNNQIYFCNYKALIDTLVSHTV